MAWGNWHGADEVRKFLRRKNVTIIVFLLLYIAAKVALYFDDHAGTFMPREVLLIMSGLPAIFITFFFANVIIRIASPSISKYFQDDLEPEQRILFAKVFEILVYAFAVAFILYSFGVTMGSLALILGFISGGLAFAVREPVLSFIIWLILLSKKPFRLGDTIRVAGYEGKVDRIGTLYLTLNPATRITDDVEIVGRPVKIPNKVFLEQPIENYGQGDVHQVLRLQIRKRPKELGAIVKDMEAIARETLKKEGVTTAIDVSLEVQNTPANDKHYLVISFDAPLMRRDALRSSLQLQICEQYKEVFFDA